MSEPTTFDPSRYASWRDTRLGAITERVERERVLEGLRAFGGDVVSARSFDGVRVLDVGTGDGTYALAAAALGATVTGVDADPAMLCAAEARAAREARAVSFVPGRVEALPFADASFDVVVAVTVLCFVEDRATAFAELARVLRPGGRLVLGELGRRSVWAVWRRVRGWLGSATWRAARFWTRAELRRELTRAGFGVVSIRGAVHYPPSARWARALAPLEARLTAVGAPGAAFLVAVADKPHASREGVSPTRRA